MSRDPVVPRVRGLLYGGDYNPEQWPEEVWLDDARLMQEAGVNLVTLGVFSWALLEPKPGVFDFDWLDRVLDLLWSHGVAVDLATPTAAPTAWLVEAHPDMLPVTRDGVRLGFGSRRHYCPSSPHFREASVRIAEHLARRYSVHPALAMWHVGNEYGGHVEQCYCETSAAHFRAWLEARYGTIEALNHAWGTAFWSQRYGDFSQVEPPRRMPVGPNPTQALDWHRFSSDALLECYELEAAVLREQSPGIPLTTNFMFEFKACDYWRWSTREDVVSLDAYPDPNDPAAHVRSRSGLRLDAFRDPRPAVDSPGERPERRPVARGQPAQASGAPAPVGASRGGARFGRCAVLPMAREPRGRREVPQWASPASRHAFPRLAGDGAPRPRPAVAGRGCGNDIAGGEGHISLRLGELVGSRSARASITHAGPA